MSLRVSRRCHLLSPFRAGRPSNRRAQWFADSVPQLPVGVRRGVSTGVAGQRDQRGESPSGGELELAQGALLGAAARTPRAGRHGPLHWLRSLVARLSSRSTEGDGCNRRHRRPRHLGGSVVSVGVQGLVMHDCHFRRRPRLLRRDTEPRWTSVRRGDLVYRLAHLSVRSLRGDAQRLRRWERLHGRRVPSSNGL